MYFCEWKKVAESLYAASLRSRSPFSNPSPSPQSNSDSEKSGTLRLRRSRSTPHSLRCRSLLNISSQISTNSEDSFVEVLSDEPSGGQSSPYPRSSSSISRGAHTTSNRPSIRKVSSMPRLSNASRGDLPNESPQKKDMQPFFSSAEASLVFETHQSRLAFVKQIFSTSPHLNIRQTPLDLTDKWEIVSDAADSEDNFCTPRSSWASFYPARMTIIQLPNDIEPVRSRYVGPSL